MLNARKGENPSHHYYSSLNLFYRHITLYRTTPQQNTGVFYNGYVVPRALALNYSSNWNVSLCVCVCV